MRTLQSLELVEQSFLEEVDFSEFEEGEQITDWAIAQQLDDSGYWLSGDEYQEVRSAKALMERLIGRAHYRAAWLSR